MNNEFITHTYSLIKINNIWYRIDTEVAGRSKKFNPNTPEKFDSPKQSEYIVKNVWKLNIEHLNYRVKYVDILSKLGSLDSEEFLKMVKMIEVYYPLEIRL